MNKTLSDEDGSIGGGHTAINTNEHRINQSA